PLLVVDAAVLAGDDLQADRLVVDQHRAVGADVGGAGIGIAGDHRAAGADVAPAVVLVPERHGQNAEVYGIAFEHVLLDRAVGYDARRVARGALLPGHRLAAQRLDQLGVG